MEIRERGSFGDLLRAFRQRRRVGQQELGAKLAVHRNTIGAWEKGERLPESRGLVVEIARHLRLDERETRQLLEASLISISPYWNVPYQRNPFFTGREQILEQLHKELGRSQAVGLTQAYALSGLGGIGKTQIAVEYAYRYYPEYSAVFWFNADSEAHLISSIVSLREVLDLLPAREKDQSQIINAVLQWLSNHRGWLLIADNVEDVALLQKYLPTARRGALLLTTRRQAIGTIAHSIEVPVMSHEEGVRFLLRRTNLFAARSFLETEQEDVSDPTIRGIVEIMDGLPLALDQAGAYMRATQCSPLDYLQRFQSSQQRLLEAYEDSSDHPLSVARTFALVFEQLERSNMVAAEFLTVCAFLAPDTIPDMFFSEGAAYLGPTLAPLASDPFQFDLAIKALLTYSLIQRHAATHTMTIHRLVQAVLKGRLSEAEQHTWATRVLHALTHLFPPWERLHEKSQLDYWLTCERLLPHALECIAYTQWDQDEAQARITLASRVAMYLSQCARFAEAEPLFLQALHLQEQALEAHHPLVTETLNGLAILYRSQGKYQQAEPLFQQVLHLREQALGSEHPLVAEALHGLAILYAEQARYEEAEPLLKRALHLRERSLGAEHPLVASCLNNLAYIYKDQRRYEEAEPLLQRALSIKERELGPEHLRVAYTLHELGELYVEQGRYEQAESLLLHARRVCERELGSEHPLGAHTLYGLGILYRKQGRYEQAEPLLLHALEIRQRHLDAQHPSVAESLHGLACLYEARQRAAEALPLYQQALAIRERAFGPHHPKTAQTRAAYTHLLQGGHHAFVEDQDDHKDMPSEGV